MRRLPAHALVLTAITAAVLGLGAPRPAAARNGRTQGRSARPAAPRQAPSALERARAQLASVKRDPQKRRFRHRWEKAIRALTAAAKGKDTGPALLSAGQARYALYRFSQVESDRDEALRLAALARRAGSREAPVFAAAVRREAGSDDGPRRRTATARRTARPPARTTAPRPAPGPVEPEPEADATPEAEEGDATLDEALSRALAAADQAGHPEPRAFQAVPEEASAEGPVRVSEIRSWSNADYTRVSISLSRPASYQKRELPAEPGHPRRLALDVQGAVLEGAALAHRVGDQLVEQVRTGQNGPDTVRVVLDLHGGQEPLVAALDDPPQILVDVRGALAEAERPAGGEGELARRRPVRRIIVDAGHGGHDTGAVGPTRVREKDVTLAIARRLRSSLAAQGYEVLLTRHDDRYLRLDERTAYANAHRGDLFISIHANANPRRERRGAETYVLNVADDRYARRLAARENGALSDDAGGAPDVKRVIADMNAQSSAEPSRRLALQVQHELVDGIREKAGEARDRGVKSALFYVLLGAAMPAVLVETAFISNRAEEKRLADPRFQEAVAQALARGISAFARGQSRVAAR